MHACAVRGRAVVGAAPGSWVPEGAGTAGARVLRAEAACNVQAQKCLMWIDRIASVVF